MVNMKRIRAAIALLACLLMAHESNAGEYIWAIGGEQPCAEWTADRLRGSKAAAIEEIWIEGFLTGANWAQAAAHGRGDSDEFLWSFIDAYCRARPSDQLSWAAASMMVALSKSR
jgi:hypothetical protein